MYNSEAENISVVQTRRRVSDTMGPVHKLFLYTFVINVMLYESAPMVRLMALWPHHTICVFTNSTNTGAGRRRCVLRDRYTIHVDAREIGS